MNTAPPYLGKYENEVIGLVGDRLTSAIITCPRMVTLCYVFTLSDWLVKCSNRMSVQIRSAHKMGGYAILGFSRMTGDENLTWFLRKIQWQKYVSGKKAFYLHKTIKVHLKYFQHVTDLHWNNKMIKVIYVALYQNLHLQSARGWNNVSWWFNTETTIKQQDVKIPTNQCWNLLKSVIITHQLLELLYII